ncbi:MAG TPA: Maf family protein [Acetobacteraceae bacterium]
MLQHSTPRLVLASASTSRRALLDAAGLRFVTHPADIDEAALKRAAQAEAASAETAALRLAHAKAAHVAVSEPDALVIGADQILVCDGIWFDKPPDRAAARTQLQTLRGSTHVLATAVVCHRGDVRLWQHIVLPRLTMRTFSDDFLDAYLALEGDHVLGSVGAYGLEGLGVHLFEAVEGDHAAILGLPLLPLFAFLRRIGVLLG